MDVFKGKISEAMVFSQNLGRECLLPGLSLIDDILVLGKKLLELLNRDDITADVKGK